MQLQSFTDCQLIVVDDRNAFIKSGQLRWQYRSAVATFVSYGKRMYEALKVRLTNRPRVTGTSALALSTVTTNLVRLVSTVCLTRLLAPEVYGITGMILSVFYTINMVTDIGLQAYVVRHPRTDEPDFLDAVFTIHAVRGVILAAIAAAVAWPLSVLLAKPEVAAPLALSSLIFVIDGMVSLHQFRGLRDGQVQRYSTMDVFAGISQTVSGIFFAFLFRNVWAIVASMFVGSVVKVWGTYALFPGGLHRFRRDREISADLWRFSRVIALSSGLTLVIAQVDKLAMARMLSLSQFGTYVIAGSLATAPTVFAFNYASAIVYPAAAAAWREGSSLAKAYYRCWGRFFYLYAFGGGVLIGGADMLIRAVYDPRYLPAARFLSILAIRTTFVLINRSMESVQVATGRQRVTVEFNLVRIVWLVGGGILAMAFNEPFVIVLTVGLIEIPVYGSSIYRMSRLGQIRWKREASFALTVAAGLLIGAVASLASRALFPNL